MRVGGILLAGLLFGACGTDRGASDTGPPGGDAAPPEPRIELGEGEIEFVPIVGGQDLWVIRGPQNGYHFLGSVRVMGIDPGNPDDRTDPRNPTTEFRVFRGTERVDLMASRYTQGLDPMGEWYGMVGRLVILDIASDAELDGVEVRIEVTVTSPSGEALTDQRTVRAVPHPNNALPPG